jgi:large subunit ribosomal protein L25
MDTASLQAQKRTTVRKGLNQLRREGFLPGVLYGPSIEAMQLQLPAHEAGQLLTRLRGTVLIDLLVDGEKHTTIVRELQRDVLRGDLLHVDFMAVAMDQMLTISVPIRLVGESPVVVTGEYAVMAGISEVEVECLARDMVNSLEIGVEILDKLGDTLTVADLNAPPGVTILSDSEDTVARVVYAGILETEEEEQEEDLELDAEDVEVIEKGKVSEVDEGSEGAAEQPEGAE